ncbi:hypothetical protein EV652_113190 [Kribbella steppae]|uniref:Uncharacterized protein n=1 Tax=Kribbella steppae TaxID=2512223 RepID=A0A4R2H3E6_9ACTN|nr:hypothetical protein EV652_113190 [Kribbella steppae]
MSTALSADRTTDSGQVTVTWQRWQPQIPLVAFYDERRSLSDPIVNYVANTKIDTVFVLIPEVEPDHLWRRLLQNQRGAILAHALRKNTNAVVGRLRFRVPANEPDAGTDTQKQSLGKYVLDRLPSGCDLEAQGLNRGLRGTRSSGPAVGLETGDLAQAVRVDRNSARGRLHRHWARRFRGDAPRATPGSTPCRALRLPDHPESRPRFRRSLVGLGAGGVCGCR